MPGNGKVGSAHASSPPSGQFTQNVRVRERKILSLFDETRLCCFPVAAFFFNMSTIVTDESVFKGLYTTHVNGAVYHKLVIFANPAEYGRWLDMGTRIKSTIATINEDKDAGHALMRECNRRLDEWVELVLDFACTFGKEKVPLDIRIAMHDVQGHLGVREFQFGPDVGVVDIPLDN